MAPLGPSIWAVSDGRAGNEAQTRALVQALANTASWIRLGHITGEAHRQEPMTLTPAAPWTWLPADRWPAPLSALPSRQRSLIAPPWPTIWIAAGRRCAAFTAHVRRASGGKTFTVHILDPHIDPAFCDLLVVPEHDDLDAENVIRATGSVVSFAPEMLEEASIAFAGLADEPGRSAIVILGGHSRTHRFTNAAARRLENQLRSLSQSGWRLRLTCSRRTPVEIVAGFRSMASDIGAAFWAGPADGQNPYLAWLLFSQAAIVTEDSANMLSDAAWHGLPVHMARLEGRSEKFDRLHEALIRRGAARWFTGKLEQWTYAPLREAEAIAETITQRLLERYPQPVFQPLPQER